jgi:hypothetical protein
MDDQSDIPAVTLIETNVFAFREGARVPARVGYQLDGAAVVVVTIEGESLYRGVGTDLFDALASARRDLEFVGITLACNGSRKDVYPSPMLREATFGRMAYVLTSPKSRERPETVDIFESAPEGANLATVDEQKAAFEDWAKQIPGGIS